ncbi:hypothetical protein Pam2_165 [Pseudanabaena phage Pam2]|nr:hypothetical protein Pam2_165 [Pseudanabaena phage Pam2]
MKTYTIEQGRPTEGILVQTRELSSGIKIPVVQVGEEGRGRQLSFLPVELNASSRTKFEAEGQVLINHISLGKTQKGGHKLIEAANTLTNDKCLIVFRTRIGFRGGNSHTGECNYDPDSFEFLPFPCEILAEGRIAQGAAGSMGSGQQLIAIAPKNIVFRTRYSGRLYGAPSSHYYLYTGSQILSATWDERVASDLF